MAPLQSRAAPLQPRSVVGAASGSDFRGGTLRRVRGYKTGFPACTYPEVTARSPVRPAAGRPIETGSRVHSSTYSWERFPPRGQG